MRLGVYLWNRIIYGFKCRHRQLNPHFESFASGMPTLRDFLINKRRYRTYFLKDIEYLNRNKSYNTSPYPNLREFQ